MLWLRRKPTMGFCCQPRPPRIAIRHPPANQQPAWTRSTACIIITICTRKTRILKSPRYSHPSYRFSRNLITKQLLQLRLLSMTVYVSVTSTASCTVADLRYGRTRFRTAQTSLVRGLTSMYILRTCTSPCAFYSPIVTVIAGRSIFSPFNSNHLIKLARGIVPHRPFLIVMLGPSREI